MQLHQLPKTNFTFLTPQKITKKPPPFLRLRPSAMSAAVEHVVLLKIRPSGDPSDLLSALLPLASLPSVSHLAAGPILRQTPNSAFTHFIHGRYPSKIDLAAYNDHPDHLAVVAGLNPISEDVLVVDWEADLAGSVVPAHGSLVRLALVKPKAGIEVDEVVKIVGEVEGLKGAVQVTKGVNFSPMAKGFDVARIDVYSGLEEFEGLGDGVVGIDDEKIRMVTDDSIGVDFVVAPTSRS